MKYFKHILFLLLWSIVNGQWSMVNAQELEARVTINHTQIETTRTEVFDALQTKLTDFLNNHKWTEIPFRENEKIQCNFNITVNTYKQDENTLECTLLMNSSRPVYGSTYNTVAYAVNDKDFTFEFNEFDQLEYQENQVDNNLVALLAYYAYMIIGMDLDTMAPMGGTDCFHVAQDIAIAGESMGFLAVIDEYGSTKAGNIACLYAAKCYAATEKYQEAIDMLEKFDGCGDALISPAAIALKGNCYAELGQNEKAAELLVEAAKEADNNTVSPTCLLQAGQLYVALGQKDKALDCYNQIKTKYQQNSVFYEIDKYIEQAQ